MENEISLKKSEDPLIRPESDQLPKWKRYMMKLDIFAFLPVPRTDPVSTKASLWGSYLLLIMFLGYVIYSFVCNNLLNKLKHS